MVCSCCTPKENKCTCCQDAPIDIRHTIDISCNRFMGGSPAGDLDRNHAPTAGISYEKKFDKLYIAIIETLDSEGECALCSIACKAKRLLEEALDGVSNEENG